MQHYLLGADCVSKSSAGKDLEVLVEDNLNMRHHCDFEAKKAKNMHTLALQYKYDGAMQEQMQRRVTILGWSRAGERDK